MFRLLEIENSPGTHQATLLTPNLVSTLHSKTAQTKKKSAWHENLEVSAQVSAGRALCYYKSDSVSCL